jgi:hypothetical protein
MRVQRHTRQVVTLVLAVMTVLSLTVPLWAQSTSGAIRGYVRDEQGAVLQDTTITASSPDVASNRETSSSSEGAYALKGLQPGTYTVTAERQGFSKFVQENVRVGGGLTLGLDITLAVAGVNEGVVVKREAPMLEISRPGQTINISGDFQRDVPLTRTGEWSQAMMMIPGVSSNVSRESASYYVHGADSQSVVWQLDGVDAMPAQLNTETRTRLSVDAIADVQIKTAVADASAPMGSMIFANVITRSGTNLFHGAGDFIYQDHSWYSSNVKGGTTAASSLNQPSGMLGGPIVRDRTWFFGSYQHVRQVLGISRSGTQLANLLRIDPGFVPFDNLLTGNFAYGKVTHHVGNIDITASSQYDRKPRTAAGSNEAGQYIFSKQGGPRQAGQMSWVLSPSLVAQFAVTYNSKGDESIMADASIPTRNIYETSSVSGATRTGVTQLGILDSSSGTGLESEYSKLVASADFTHTRTIKGGTHDISFGVYFQRQPEVFRTILANGGLYLQDEVLRNPNVPSEGTILFHTQTGSPTDLLTLNNIARDTAVYVQDMWRPHPRVTVAAGVRLEAVSRKDLLFDLRAQDSLDVGPRFGVTAALDDASHNVVHAAFGKIQDALTRTRISGTGTATLTLTDKYDLDLDGTLETTFVTPGGVKTSPNRRYDSSFHQPYVNDLTAGYRRQLWGQTALDVTWLRRTFRDDVAQIDVNGIYDGVVFKGYRDESLSDVLLITNNQWNRRLYQDVAFQLSKRWSRGQVLGSYTRAFQHELEGGWEPNTPSSFLQPGTFANDLASPVNWRDHAVRIAGNLNLYWGMRLSAEFTAQSGLWSGPIVTQIAAADPTFGPSRVTLSNGRIVTNPLATTTRFAYATRGDGQIKADGARVLDLRVAREFALPFGRGEVSLSAFNLANGDAAQFVGDTNLRSSTFGLLNSVQPPRAFQLGLRVQF